MADFYYYYYHYDFQLSVLSAPNFERNLCVLKTACVLFGKPECHSCEKICEFSKFTQLCAKPYLLFLSDLSTAGVGPTSFLNF